ncbi:cyclophilin-like domain-containing protein [Pelagophyceae sp. CCMP2097]|nr:cyclophilin-like domain-containing protein [Pelagophyceae sp. CCMP2097]|mmetsp:Transcript_132/g.519  ORF Transcript_132/g.519 Transcript_132/m.519 type:complete len:173 (+) Transcript_132:200-718(+)
MSVTLHTDMGDLKMEVFCDTAPRTSFNFLALCASGYYDGTLFHRSIKGFMAQAGDPTGTGKGGESIWGGTFDDEFHNANLHDRRGTVSMANKGAGTNKSQFFITYTEQPHLNNRYTVFGRVIHGFEVLEALEKLPVGKKDKPNVDVHIKKITIHANPLAERDIVYHSPHDNQ